MTTTTTPKPPSSLQFAIAVIWAKATFALVHAVQSLLMQGSDEAALLGLTDTNLLIGAAGGILAAVLLYVAGWLTWKGSRSARLITGVIVVAVAGFRRLVDRQSHRRRVAALLSLLKLRHRTLPIVHLR